MAHEFYINFADGLSTIYESHAGHRKKN